MCCTRLDENTGRKKVAKNRHLVLQKIVKTLQMYKEKE